VIIEDELLVAWSLEEVLESLGHEVLNIYPNGEAALAGGIDDASLLIVDINLGAGLDGIATAARLRQTTNASVVFCSAYSDVATRERAVSAVPNAAFVVKPFVERDLLHAIEAATRTKQ
jgi:CheY-like chemotaxis protein